MKNDKKILRLLEIKERVGNDKLGLFALAGEEDITELREEYLNDLFMLAIGFGFTYIYIGKGELCGCEHIPDAGGTWPAIWSISRELFTESSCGNSDQYQNNDYKGRYFPEDAYGAWNVVTGKKLTDKKAHKLKFNKVVTGNGVLA